MSDWRKGPPAPDALWRRPDGHRRLIYLDQSTLSYAASPQGHELQTLLLELVAADRVVCLASPEHTDESRLALRSYEQLHDLLDKLSMGIRFKWENEIRESEIMNAAAEFAGAPQRYPNWREAFEKDPHLPMERIYAAGVRLSVGPDTSDWQRDEVMRQKAIPPELDDLYESIRASGRTFRQQADAEFQGAVRGYLTPFFGPREFFTRMDELYVAGIAEQAPPGRVFGPTMSRYLNARRQWDFFEALRKNFPLVQERPAEFLTSEALWRCPSLQFPSLLFAATAMASKDRKAKPGDVYDRAHITLGLSRCDLATADHGMTQMCRDRSLIPSGVQLFSSREHPQLLRYLRTL